MTAPPRSSEPQEPMLFGWMSLPMLKTIGYLISTVSVVLLAIVSWPKAKDSAFLAACLIGGAWPVSQSRRIATGRAFPSSTWPPRR
jgi:hypothetical protein